LQAEQDDLDDRLAISHLGSRERHEARALAGAFSRMVAAGPPGGTSGHEAEHPGPEHLPAGTSRSDVEQNRKEQDDDSSDHKDR